MNLQRVRHRKTKKGKQVRKENGVIDPKKDTRGKKMRVEGKKNKINRSRGKDMNFPTEKAHQVFKTMG